LNKILFTIPFIVACAKGSDEIEYVSNPGPQGATGLNGKMAI